MAENKDKIENKKPQINAQTNNAKSQRELNEKLDKLISLSKWILFSVFALIIILVVMMLITH